MRLKIAAMLLVSIALIGCDQSSAANVSPHAVDDAVEQCVIDFRSALVGLAHEHDELTHADTFPVSPLGYTFVNDKTTPRTHIVLVVVNHPARQVVPANGYDPLPRTNLGTALTVETANPQLRDRIETLYGYFRAALANRMSRDHQG